MRRSLGLVLPPALAVALYFLSKGSGLPDAGRATAAVAVLMAGWWLTEALPLAATSLVPVALFPLVGAASIQRAAAPYAHKLVFLFMGGFMIAAAMERWELHRRIALLTVSKVGARPARIVAGFMLATAFLSLWVSNTATTLMMLPIGMSVVALVAGGAREETAGRNFATCLVLGIAYSASIGGIGTLIGTPPNALLAAFMEQQYGEALSFSGWLGIGLPVAAAMLPLCWVLLTKVLFPIRMAEVPGGRELLDRELARLGPMGPAERRVLAVFVIVALTWCLRPLLARAAPAVFGSLDDAGVAILGALALFILPSGEEEGGRVLDWKAAERLPWGVLLLFGGGLSLALAISDTGLAGFLGGLFSGLKGVGPLGLALLVTAMIVLLTELTSNTATTAAFLPIFAAVAAGAGVPPRMLLFATALGASCAFMMPVATPPNAIVFASGNVTMRQMFRAGVWLNAAAIVVITAWVWCTQG
ncbi:MAG: DASS family sodium-coupled anion symporter [Elusimicrobiota bacterium]